MKKWLIIILIPLFAVGFFVGYFFAKVDRSAVSNHGRENNFHYSQISQSDYYDDFFDSGVGCKNNYNKSVKGLVVNHHLLAGKFIAQALCQVATDKNITVILLSPNHFGNGDGQVISSVYDWQTPYEILKSDRALISKLASDGIISIDELPFEEEHGVYNIIPFIKKTIPNAKIVPIMIKDSVSQEEKNNLIKFLGDNLPKNSLIIASLDFSHYLSSEEADKADEQTLKMINEFNLDMLKNLNPNAEPDNVDSKPVLEIFLKTMSQKQATNFQLIAHSNSAKLVEDMNVEETTSYIVGLFLRK